MLIRIDHRTTYRYDVSNRHIVQVLRLTPRTTASQRIEDWSVTVGGEAVTPLHTDAFGNAVSLATPHGAAGEITVTAAGRVSTHDSKGVTGPTDEALPAGVFLRKTKSTAPDAAIRNFALSARREDPLEGLHALLTGIHAAVAFDTDATHVGTTAADAFADKRGVCQDHAHIFIAAARVLGHPARYVTGYMRLADETQAVAHHAWAEAHVSGLGWTGFDPANGICPTENYVRLGCGLDAAGASPIKGARVGRGAELMSVSVSVQQIQQQ